MIKLRDYQSEIIEEVRSKWKEGKKRLVVCSPTGCHEKGYKIRMFDGTTKNVEDVVVGDELMGGDGNKRTVLSLHRGYDWMYEVSPSDGNSFIVNGGHIFPLYSKNRNLILELSVEEYFDLDYDTRIDLKLIRFNDTPVYFSIEESYKSNYYGFTIDGDHLYCDWQGFVHHNSGKTVIFSYIAQQAAIKGSSILIITHRDELLTQTGGTLQDFNLNPTIITAAVKHPPKSNLYVAMTKTLANRLKKHEWDEWYRNIDLVIIDEMHEQSFNWIFGNQHTQNKYVLGFSATPNRTGNQRQLSLDYEDMVVGKDVQELINLKYLVPDRYFCVPVDMKGVSKSQGDYNTEEMFSRYNRTELYAGVIDNWKRICPDTITIVFCCNIQHTINTCKAFNEAGIKAKFIVSDVAKPSLPENPDKADMSKYKIKCDEYDNYIQNYSLYSGVRKEVINDWKNGEFKVLINAGIATTGFDHKPIQTVIVNRATTSDNLLLQILGRGSRISDGKEHFYILDFGENCKRLGYYRQQREYSLTHEVGKGGGGVPASKECPKCKSLVIASSTVCKYCGFIFPKTRKEEIVELREVDYTSAKKELQTIKDYELFAEAKGYNKNWLFRQIYIKWGKDGLVEYQKKNNLQPGWPYRMIAMYRAQGLRNNE